MKELTIREEIAIISRSFNIPIEEIEKILKEPLKNNLRVLKNSKKRSVLIVETEKTAKQLVHDEPADNQRDFTDFEKFYVEAVNSAEEINTIKKFLTACREAKHTKMLYELCPENENKLREEILSLWVNLADNYADLREVKLLTAKGSRAGEIAYRKYLKFF